MSVRSGESRKGAKCCYSDVLFLKLCFLNDEQSVLRAAGYWSLLSCSLKQRVHRDLDFPLQRKWVKSAGKEGSQLCCLTERAGVKCFPLVLGPPPAVEIQPTAGSPKNMPREREGRSLSCCNHRWDWECLEMIHQGAVSPSLETPGIAPVPSRRMPANVALHSTFLFSRVNSLSNTFR